MEDTGNRSPDGATGDNVSTTNVDVGGSQTLPRVSPALTNAETPNRGTERPTRVTFGSPLQAMRVFPRDDVHNNEPSNLNLQPKLIFPRAMPAPISRSKTSCPFVARMHPTIRPSFRTAFDVDRLHTEPTDYNPHFRRRLLARMKTRDLKCGRPRKDTNISRSKWLRLREELTGFPAQWTDSDRITLNAYHKVAGIERRAHSMEITSRWRRIPHKLTVIKVVAKNLSDIASEKNSNILGNSDTDDQAVSDLLKKWKLSKPVIGYKARSLLKTDPGTRTVYDVEIILHELQSFPKFCLYSFSAQQEIAKYGLLRHIDQNQTIIRQGQRSETWYFLVSGQGITKKIDEKTKDETFGFLSSGDSFGDLAVSQGTLHTASLVARCDMEVLTLERQDYLRAFKINKIKQDMPGYLLFLKDLDIMKGWPCERFLKHRTQCFVRYYRRGTLVVNDSTSSEWLIVVRSGNCDVYLAVEAIKASWRQVYLKLKHPMTNIISSKGPNGNLKRLSSTATPHDEAAATETEPKHRQTTSTQDVPAGSNKHQRKGTRAQPHEEDKSARRLTSETFLNVSQNARPSQTSEKDMAANSSQLTIEQEETLKPQPEKLVHIKSPVVDSGVTHRKTHDDSNSTPVEAHSELTQPELQKRSSAWSRRRSYSIPKKCRPPRQSMEKKTDPFSCVYPPSFIIVDTLKTGDFFVSKGAELIFISKSYFMAFSNSHTLAAIRNRMPIYPSSHEVQSQYRMMKSWQLHLDKCAANHEAELERERKTFGVVLPDVRVMGHLLTTSF